MPWGNGAADTVFFGQTGQMFGESLARWADSESPHLFIPQRVALGRENNTPLWSYCRQEFMLRQMMTSA